MTSTSAEYSISKIKKLIDLNGDMVNFRIHFRVYGDQPFQALIVDQNTLDTDPEIKFKDVNGELSGDIVSDNGIYQPHFMILKSDMPSTVTVDLFKEELQVSKPNQPVETTVATASGDQNNYMTFIAVGIILACVAYYVLYYKKDSTSSSSSSGGALPKSDMYESLLSKLKKVSLE
jgi:hypothetical protein